MKCLRLFRVLTAASLWAGGAVMGSTLEFVDGGEFALTGSATGTGSPSDPVVVAGNMEGESGFLDIFNLHRYGNFAFTTHEDAIWIRVELFNGTDEVWDNLDFELQTVVGQPSTNPDGLSFAQGYQLNDRPWTSQNFGVFEEFDQDRDFINFTGGTVMPGQTAIVSYIISHNGRANPVHLLMRPNFSPVIPPIPEPSTWALALLAAVMGWFSIRRRRL